MDNSIRLETTLGDLIAAASEVAFEFSNNDKDGYNLTRLALLEMLKKTNHSKDLSWELETLSSPSWQVH